MRLQLAHADIEGIHTPAATAELVKCFAGSSSKATRVLRALQAEGVERLILYKRLVTLRKDVPLHDIEINSFRFDSSSFPNPISSLSVETWVKMAPSLERGFHMLNKQFKSMA